MKDHFVWTKPNALTPEFCEHIIQRFESTEEKRQGFIGGEEIKVDLSVKRSIDYNVHYGRAEWKEECDVFHQSLHQGLIEYINYMRHLDVGYGGLYITNQLEGDLKDSGYQIQRTDPGGFYIWHSDYVFDVILGTRIFTYIWYLNDVHEDGYTEFYNGDRVQPEQGKLLIFPATWNFVHRGYPPKSEVKYIVTGWLYHNPHIKVVDCEDEFGS